MQAPRLKRRGVAALAASLLICGTATARLFIWPASGMPARVSAIVMLAGPGDRLQEALRLAREGRAPFLLISRGNHGYGGPCPSPVPHVRLVCFEPNPASTRGEAEFAASLASKYHWHSLALVTSTVQDFRARQRMRNCFSGRVYVVTVGLPWLDWPGQIAYEWAATIKMAAWQRAC